MRRAIAIAVCGGIVCAVSAISSTAQEGTVEKLGKKIDQGVGKIADELREDWASARRSIEKMGMQGRVFGRLRWDKALQDAKVEVESRTDRIVVLKGSVPTAAARLKAVQLAQDTVGVTEVVDELVVGPLAGPTTK